MISRRGFLTGLASTAAAAAAAPPAQGVFPMSMVEAMQPLQAEANAFFCVVHPSQMRDLAACGISFRIYPGDHIPLDRVYEGEIGQWSLPMPWTPADATSKTKKADTPKRRRQWSAVANSALERGASDKSAIMQANAVVGRSHFSPDEEKAMRSRS